MNSRLLSYFICRISAFSCLEVRSWSGREEQPAVIETRPSSFSGSCICLISVLRKSFVCMHRIRFWHTFLVRCTDTPLHNCPQRFTVDVIFWSKKVQFVTSVPVPCSDPAHPSHISAWAVWDEIVFFGWEVIFPFLSTSALIYSVNYVNGEKKKGKRDAWCMSAWYCCYFLVLVRAAQYFTWQEVQCQVKQSWQLISCTVGMHNKYLVIGN